MPRKLHLPNLNDLIRRYQTGDSINVLAKRAGVGRKALGRAFQEAGVRLRTQSEAELVKWSRMTEQQRARQVKKAHDAVRGATVPMARRVRHARTKALKGGHDSRDEATLAGFLRARGLSVIPQMQVGPYNCDLGVPPVAVEVFGGHWHWTGRHLRRLNARVDYLFNAGYHVLVVQTSGQWPLREGIADYIVALHEIACRNPALPREYRVVRGAGQVVAFARSDMHDRSLVPAFRVTRNALGRYESVPE